MDGKVADQDDKENSLKSALIFTSFFIILIPFIQKFVLMYLALHFTNIKIGAILATLALFFVPSFFMGIITPLIIRLKIDDLENAGKSTGKINAIATIGGITGTFLGGFVLIPNFGSSNILFVLTILLACLIPVVDCKLKEKSSIFAICMILISAISMNIYMNLNNNMSSKIIENASDSNEFFSLDTQYGRVLIYNTRMKGENVRILDIDNGYESATFTDPDKIYDLVFEYTKYYDLMFNANIDVKNTLLIGGAGYSYPKYYISNYLDKNMDVVEIDGGITEVAKKYFYLDKLFDEYNLLENKRLNLITEDGRTYLNRIDKKYDAILNDAFSGETPAKTLTTLENVKNVKKALNPNGVYLTNIISALENDKNSRFLKAEVNTLKQVFKNVYVVPCNSFTDTELLQNNMVIATDDNLFFENEYKINIEENEIILTDEYCPVDTLLPEHNN